MGDQTSASGLLLAFGLAFFAVGGQPLVNYLSGDNSIKNVLPSLVTVTVGLGLVLCAIFRKFVFDGDGALVRTLSRWGSSPIPYAIIALSVWIYFETLAVQRNIELATLRNDQQSIANVMSKLVLPRQISEAQSNAIAQFLKNFPAQEINFEVVQGDDEASNYRADLQRALERGGWHVKNITYPQLPIQSGLSIHFQQTMEHTQITSDYKNPKIDLILRMALGNAGVFVGGTGGGSSISTTEDSLTIKIGRKRNDGYTLMQNP